MPRPEPSFRHPSLAVSLTRGAAVSTVPPCLPARPQILLVKTSSLGDVVHNLPVVDDLRAAFPGVAIDWLVEQAFADIPRMHPGVRAVIPCALRRWRRAPWASATRSEWRTMRSVLQAQRYDLVIDTQGLLKSALLATLASGPRAGFDRASAREPLASRFYRYAYPVSWLPHAVERNRSLVAQAGAYALSGPPHYGLQPLAGAADTADTADTAASGLPATAATWDGSAPFAVLLHATARAEKLWPESSWIALGRELHERLGLRTVIPWGTPDERERSERLAAAIPGAQLPGRSSIALLARGLAKASVAIGVDTGLLHLASALGVRCIGLYVATDPARNGLYPESVGRNLGGIGEVPAVAEVLSEVSRVTAWPAVSAGAATRPAV